MGVGWVGWGGGGGRMGWVGVGVVVDAGGGEGGDDGGECILRSKNCIVFRSNSLRTLCCEYSLTVGITVSSALQTRASGSEPSIT